MDHNDIRTIDRFCNCKLWMDDNKSPMVHRDDSLTYPKTSSHSTNYSCLQVVQNSVEKDRVAGVPASLTAIVSTAIT